MTNMETMNLVPFTRSVAVVVCGLWLAARLAPRWRKCSTPAGRSRGRRRARRRVHPPRPRSRPRRLRHPARRMSWGSDVFGSTRGSRSGCRVGAFGDNTGASFGGALDFGVGPRPDACLGRRRDRLPALRHGDPAHRPVPGPARGRQRRRHHEQRLPRARPSCGSNRERVAFGPTRRGCWGSVTPIPARRPIWGNDAGASTTHLGDYAPSAGFGGGVTVVLVAGRDAGLSLGLGLRYLTGGDVSYLTRGAIQRDEHGATFEPERSPLSMLRAQIGIAVDF